MAAATATQAAADPGGSKNYKSKGEVYFDDGREDRLLEFVKSKCESRANLQAQDLLAMIDDFGASESYMMNVGAAKGAIVTSVIAEHKPRVMIELGGYVGYSTLLFADAVRKNGGKKYLSLEFSPKFAKIAQTFVELAGLADFVRILVGSSSKSLVAEHAKGQFDEVDMIFLDHYKPVYVRDIKICESLGMIRQGTVLAADNVISPGNPPYLEYVRSSPEEKRSRLGQQQKEDEVKTHYEDDDPERDGVPEIVYESRLIHSYEPTGDPDGVEVTICNSAPVAK